MAVSQSGADARGSFRFYLFAFGISWGAGGIGLLLGHFVPGLALGPRNPLWYVAGYGPTIAAILMLHRSGGWPAVRARAKKLIPTSRHWGWYVTVLLGFPLIAEGIAMRWFGYRIPPEIGPASFPWLVLVTFVTDVGPQGEEFGWRGWALPDLLKRRSPLASALILGVIWGLWHLPLFFISSTNQSHIAIPVFFVNTVSLSILMTWMYRLTDGDLALMILIHLMSNVTAGVLRVPEVAATLAEAVMATAVLFGMGLGVRPSGRGSGVGAQA